MQNHNKIMQQSPFVIQKKYEEFQFIYTFTQPEVKNSRKFHSFVNITSNSFSNRKKHLFEMCFMDKILSLKKLPFLCVYFHHFKIVGRLFLLEKIKLGKWQIMAPNCNTQSQFHQTKSFI